MPADLPFPSRHDPFPSPDSALGPSGDHGSPDAPALRTVRLAWAVDAPSVAAAQAADLRRVLALRGDAAGLPEPADLEPAWVRAITRPPTARHRVLVAVELDVVVGFAATAPAEDPDSDVATDGEVVAVHAVATGDHATAAAAEAALSELLAALTAAAADTLAADGFTRAQIWVASTDDVLRVVLTEAGWAPDGATRAFDPDTRDPDTRDPDTGEPEPSEPEPGEPVASGQPLHQIRLHVGLGESGAQEPRIQPSGPASA